jgi:hypothetical protein
MFGLIAGIAGGLLQNSAARRAANAQTNAANADLAFQRETRDETIRRLDPFYQGGIQGNQAYLSELGLGAAPAGFQGYSETPGNAFLRREGMDAIQASAAAQGGLFSAATMEDLGRQNMDFSNTFREQYLNRLAGLADSGQNAAAMQGTAGANAAAGVSNALAARGNAQAAGAIGGANALTGGINNAIAGWGYQSGMSGQRSPQINGNSNLFNPLFGGRGLGGFV